MQVIGICRFSYLGHGGFQVEHDTLEDRAAYLYAPERMEERFRTFEALTLPPLRAQTDPDFTFLVVTGDSLPATYMTRLQALLADLPQAVIQTHPPGLHRQVMQAAINSVRRAEKQPCLQFRMDDDDAVARVYVERLRAAAEDLRKLSRKHRHIAIDFNQGYVVRPGPDGLAATATQRPFTTAALAVMFKPSVKLSVMNFAHEKLPQMMPAISFTGEDMLLRGHNDYNDSRQKPGIKPITLRPLDAGEEAHFRQTYNIDADQVRRIFAGSATPGSAPASASLRLR
ncbi:putative rhamnosyl transferase [Pseudodonghicola xiamenensis]|uniref:DNA-directed RNA polymerase subunit beta n=2 Tax=Pseudodonghicola xiamenensis TaxID=337702 RepID=A0A8J3H9Q2_9RHOB|nr:putative rhamnosyl transferase [Pseudodonghicola xiamenensis]GHH03818.1 DNA-directed RNA polymerase subunit beta' [Pseudodonghicola xiamenensis]